jgi:sulfite reductase beta subunit-like hemoprotein
MENSRRKGRSRSECARRWRYQRQYRRLPEEIQALVANYDSNRQNGKSFLSAARRIGYEFLSDYVVYNNFQIAETAEGLLRNRGSLFKFFS